MRNLYLSLFSGILLALSFPTYGFSWLIFFAFVPLLLLEENLREKGKKSKRKVFLLSYLTFLIFNTITSWWIWNASPFGALFAIFVNSLLMTLVFLIYHSIAKRVSQKKSLLFLISLWICFENLHLYWDFSWPWLTLGNVFSENIKWIQWYEFTGVFGGTLWVWIVNSILYINVLHLEKTAIIRVKGFSTALVFILIPIFISLGIFWKYEEKGTPTEIIVLQPNINPYTEKYTTSNYKTSQILKELALEKLTEKTRFILAPETTFADNISLHNAHESPEVIEWNFFVKNLENCSFLGGISMYEFIFQKEKTNPQSNFIPERNHWFNDYNSAFFLTKDKNISFYHKSKLVIGVENFPLQGIAPEFLKTAMIDLGGTIALKTIQSERSVFSNSTGEKVAPIICYESIYGEFVTDYVKNGAQFLGVITNDAWWGNTQGHKQLLSFTRLRAIETRKSIARSSNSGISAFINQKGEIQSSLGYEKKGALKDTLLLNNEKTFYTLYGDFIARISLFIAIGIFLISVTKKRLFILPKN